METYYVRARGGAVWHWRRDCSLYPRTLLIEASRRERPVQNLCEECRGLEYLRSLAAGRPAVEQPEH